MLQCACNGRGANHLIVDYDVFKLIVDNIGGTEFGHARSFRYIARAVVNNTEEILSIVAPVKL